MNVDELNALTVSSALPELMRCCGSTRWAERMCAARPFASLETVLIAADVIWNDLDETDWREAFIHHPRIGDVDSLRKKFAATAEWASGEQAGVNQANEETLQGLAEGNQRYEEKFGFIFIVCATGKTAGDMLALLRERLPHDPTDEVKIAAEEQRKITRIRLNKWLTPSTE